MSNDWVYDTETYPNVFTIAFEHCDAPVKLCFEVSNYRDDSAQLFKFLEYLHSTFARLVGFNNVGFDYPVLHLLLKMGRGDAPTLYAKAMEIIQAEDKQDRWANMVKPSDRHFPQIDLMLIHHFDNNARRTSLKALEFNMRLDTIEDLPFPPGTILTAEQIAVLKQYNLYDVSATKTFYHHTKGMIAFREELSRKYHRDFLNHNDTKIGKDYFQMELEAAGISCYTYGRNGRQPRQTTREVLHLNDAILPWIKFEHPEFQRVLEYLRQQRIVNTKGSVKIESVIDGMSYDFGTGGIHASRKGEIIESDAEHMILDLDVTSFYPNLAIKNRFFPEHLGEKFVEIYQHLFEQRKNYPKKSSESQMLKLALNGVYGDSGNPYSVFYDPLFTMKITMNGQLLLCLLAENLMKVPGLRLLQANTDGLTVKLPRTNEPMLREVCKWWESVTQLTLEDVEYRQINIRDVNNYLAVPLKGSTKRKGAYEWQAGTLYDNGYDGWNQDASFVVVPKVAEKVLVEGVSIRDTVMNWPEPMDFMMRIKVKKTMHGRPCYLRWGDEEVQLTARYCVTTDGKPLIKYLPPTPTEIKEGKTDYRPKNVESGWNVTICNRLTPEILSNLKFDYEYYIQEVEKLVMVLK